MKEVSLALVSNFLWVYKLNTNKSYIPTKNDSLFDEVQQYHSPLGWGMIIIKFTSSNNDLSPLSSWSWWVGKYFTKNVFLELGCPWCVWTFLLVKFNRSNFCFCSSLSIDVSNISLKIWCGKLIWHCSFSKFNMENLDGFGS